ncbi:benzoate/H(+) symporter BenE family transporter [Azospirillum sp. RWY-5-1]|uniref:Benzoate/H(+) symporter BenE family transporter n=1 Tax=Azospirillum oleiclasticum TaxID=2735135 RepID=A0ABX2T8X6_9PROT|nr:benzoate/H(+) symporter BenE family transporter [Azospirillum oleiclasticum]NYZ13568.1 benzoate/H(+) symporter BenE family transporter [Azospirillum oleiclasticum]NYZ20728.1 benzoate/H(+) symporter BenE family transporter [Azospirillum oleiclasticum]
MRFSVVASAVVATLVGFGGTLALIVSAAHAVGADTAQTASWVTAICLATAAISAILSVRHRIPIIAAWSTPGAALIASSAVGIGMEAATGAFLLAGALIVATAAFRPLGDAVARIPGSIAAAMLAGVLLRFVVAVFEHAQAQPKLVLPLVALFLLVRLASPSAAALAVLGAGVPLALGLGLMGSIPLDASLSTVVLVHPSFEPSILLGLGVPLYLVTMASQNLPGFAVLRAAGYTPPTRSILAVSGLCSVLSAPFGAHTTNLAAITAAICTGPDTHPDASRRWTVGVAYAVCYVVLAAFGASLVTLFAALPVALIATVAGMALVGALSGALSGALAVERDRLAAVLTFAVTASGASFLGIGSAFWGLVAGLTALGLEAGARRVRAA